MTLTSLKAALAADLTMLMAPTQASAKDREVLAWPRRWSWLRVLSAAAEAKSQLEKSVP